MSADKSPEDKKGAGAKALLARILAALKKNKGLVIAGLVLAVGVVGVVYAVAGGDDAAPEEANPSVEVPVPGNTTETEDPGTYDFDDEDAYSDEAPPGYEDEEEPPATEEPTDPGEESEAPDEGGDDESSDERVPEGEPVTRGDVPAEFPLPDDYTFASTTEEDGATIINGTVSDTRNAIDVIRDNLIPNDYIPRSQVINGDTALWQVDGPGMPDGSSIRVTNDGHVQIRIAQG